MRKAIFENQPQTLHQEEPTIAGPNRNYGKVPNYLNRFKENREVEQKMRAIEDEDAMHPPGTRRMPEEER